MLEAEVREILKDGEVVFMPDHSLGCGWSSFYVNWKAGDSGIVLDAWFELEELEAIVWWMRNKK